MPSQEDIAAERARRQLANRAKWRTLARPEQIRPADCVHWLYLAGRGAGKTRSAAERIRERIESGEAKRIALIGATFADVRDTMVEGESGLKAVCGDLFAKYNRSIGEIVFKSGCTAKFFSGEDPDALRGPQSTDVWGDELCAWKYAQQTYDMAMFGLRIGNPEAIWTTTPKNIPVLRALMDEKGCKITRGSTYSNRANLAPAFFESIVKKYEGTRLGQQELEGLILEDVAGALWERAWFETEDFRLPAAFGAKDGRIVCTPPVPLVKIVVALDPTISDPEKKKDPNKEMDACGVVVAGLGEDGKGYVLGDFTAMLSAPDWARLGVKLYGLANANGIVAEANQGGTLIEEMIKGVAHNIPVELVHASSSKRSRAEPVALLYEQGRAHHCGRMDALEDQMCSWDASDPSQRSPNNIDALVWAFHGLGLCVATGMKPISRLTVNR